MDDNTNVEHMPQSTEAMEEKIRSSGADRSDICARLQAAFRSPFPLIRAFVRNTRHRRGPHARPRLMSNVPHSSITDYMKLYIIPI